tara:strand:+ start:5182 stop:5445 length:264 start_codon:yes stop_codon:yes gene_type:complete
MSYLTKQPEQNYTFNFLGNVLNVWCFQTDLLFLIDFMTSIETHGDIYWMNFQKINSGHLTIPLEIVDHINSYLFIFERDRKIDSVLL